MKSQKSILNPKYDALRSTWPRFALKNLERLETEGFLEVKVVEGVDNYVLIRRGSTFPPDEECISL